LRIKENRSYDQRNCNGGEAFLVAICFSLWNNADGPVKGLFRQTAVMWMNAG